MKVKMICDGTPFGTRIVSGMSEETRTNPALNIALKAIDDLTEKALLREGELLKRLADQYEQNSNLRAEVEWLKPPGCVPVELARYEFLRGAEVERDRLLPENSNLRQESAALRGLVEMWIRIFVDEQMFRSAAFLKSSLAEIDRT